MKNKAYIVGISPLVRVVVPENATEKEVIDAAIEKMRKTPNEYIHATHCDEVREDTECHYNPRARDIQGGCACGGLPWPHVRRKGRISATHRPTLTILIINGYVIQSTRYRMGM